jgi:hypothetical protein
LDKVPLSGCFFVLDCEVGVAEDIKYPITFLVFNFFPNGYSLDMLWEIVVCSSF